jgi:hypothetical protein
MQRVILPIVLLLIALVPESQSQSQTGEVSGRVIRFSGEPLNRAFVSLNVEGGAASWNRTAITGNDGAFRFDNVPPGQYRIVVERYGYLTQEYGQRSYDAPGSVITIIAGQQLEADVRMSPAGSIAGRVFTTDGEPAANIFVEAWSYQYRNGVRTLTREALGIRTNDLGEYRLFWLPPGD